MHTIRLRGARCHNLRGVDLDLRPGELVGVAGPSGSGKSSLALDTLYSEGQRRFVESFSPYARQFLERLERPPMDALDPVAAAVAVDRRAPVKSSRSTVATMADLEAYLSGLFTREAIPVCPDCGVPAERDDPRRSAERTASQHAGKAAVVTYPLRVRSPEDYLDAREALLADGYGRALVRGSVRDLDGLAPSEVLAERRLSVVVDRLKVTASGASRLGQAVEEAWRRGDGEALVWLAPTARDFEDAELVHVKRGISCRSCGRSFEPAAPGLFSYESPVGACATCRGFGRTIGIDWDKVFPDGRKSLAKGAIRPWSGKSADHERKVLKTYCAKQAIPMDVPWSSLTDAQRTAVIEGEGSWTRGRFPGVRAWFEWLETRTYKMHVRVLLARYRAYDPCRDCGGKRLGKASLGYRVGDLDLAAWHGLELDRALERLRALRSSTAQGELARAELERRLDYLTRVGLGYLTLDRQARTLSGGEAQRVSLTAALGTSLTGALFVLDEPSVGLSHADLDPLVTLVRELARRGNVVLLVEHEPALLAACDRVIELGPGSGAEGGAIVFDGTPAELARAATPTGEALAPRAPAPRTSTARTGALRVEGARANNLRDLTVDLPLGVLAAIGGPSGSGKSTLLEQVLYRAAARALGQTDVDPPGAHAKLLGLGALRSVVLVDQAPLGRTSRGNPATYSGAWSRVRELFAATDDARRAGLEAGAFSFNVAGGRCEACSGEGFETVEMQFLADVALSCPVCRGRRFREEVLAVKWRGRSIADVLDMTVAQALDAFELEGGIVRALAPLSALGLEYVRLGQPLTTLSGGEAQRIKLARAMSEANARTLLLLDEPSAGLHPQEVGRLLAVLRRLAHTTAGVLLVDHDLDMLGAADWVLELGPGAGSRGGEIVALGTPAELGLARSPLGLALAARARRRAPSEHEPAPDVPHGQTGGRAIEVFGAREHNLKNVDARVPHGSLTVFTGPSGSGKSTLAFDVIFAEGQRRFLETLTPYARQFLPTLPRPVVDRVLGVPPSIALEQHRTRAGLTSTVATVTEVGHYLRLLFAKVGTPHCPTCDVPIEALAPSEVLARVHASSGKRGKGCLLAPAVVSRKGTYLDVFTTASRAGIERAVADGKLVDTDAPPRLLKSKEHSIDLVMFEGALATVEPVLLERVLSLGKGSVKVAREPLGEAVLLSTARACPRCGAGVPELDPRFFSWNTKQGRCDACDGAGVLGGAEALAEGGPTTPCAACSGSRLSPLPRAVRLGGERFHEVTGRSVEAALAFGRALAFSGDRARIAEAPLGELVRRLRFAEDVGLGYLGLDRRAATLSGGEMQRLRLSAQLGSGLTGALYVLDEPTVGLHPRDTSRLLRNLRALTSTGSTVLLVEHDADTIRAADFLVDLGPTGGSNGGHIVAAGPAAEVLASASSPTARALSQEKNLARSRASLPVPSGAELVLEGVTEHNLRLERVRIPTGRLVVVAGVSGSGKSTLVRKVLYPALRQALGLLGESPGAHTRLRVPASIGRALAVDQSPIGRTPRSVPATFLGVWDEVRKLFAASPDAKVKGFGPARFSFNTPAGGRCTTCSGQGSLTHEMAFLPDAVTTCPACGGGRFEPTTLEVRYLGLSVGDLLDRSAEELVPVFTAHPKIRAPLETMVDLGVGYLRVGQGSHTLSGGEAQRLKLAAELGTPKRVGTKDAVYVLDEPTTGLHLGDVVKLLAVLGRLVERGDTLVVIEHHPVVIANADWIIELGPDAGERGGQVVAEGTPEAVAEADTATGRVLRGLGRGKL